MILVMPQIGMTMQEGKIVKWLKQDGEKINKGEPMLLLGTEKLETEIEAPSDGVLRIIAMENTTVLCGVEVGEIIE